MDPSPFECKNLVLLLEPVCVYEGKARHEPIENPVSKRKFILDGYKVDRRDATLSGSNIIICVFCREQLQYGIIVRKETSIMFYTDRSWAAGRNVWPMIQALGWMHCLLVQLALEWAWNSAVIGCGCSTGVGYYST